MAIAADGKDFINGTAPRGHPPTPELLFGTDSSGSLTQFIAIKGGPCPRFCRRTDNDEKGLCQYAPGSGRARPARKGSSTAT